MPVVTFYYIDKSSNGSLIKFEHEMYCTYGCNQCIKRNISEMIYIFQIYNVICVGIGEHNKYEHIHLFNFKNCLAVPVIYECKDYTERRYIDVKLPSSQVTIDCTDNYNRSNYSIILDYISNNSNDIKEHIKTCNLY